MKGCSVKTFVDKKCHYHQRDSLSACNQIGPPGLSQEIYYRLYPYALALLFGGRFNGAKKGNDLIIRCQHTKDFLNGETEEVLYRVITKRKGLSEQIINLIKTMIMPFFPLSIEHHKIYFAPLDKNTKQKDAMLYQMYLGKKIYNILTKESKQLCPAAFHSFYPIMLPEILKRQYGERYDRVLVGCPDHHINIKLQFNVDTDGDGQVEEKEGRGCQAPADFLIEVIESDNEQAPYFKLGRKFFLRDILKEIGIPCFSAWHVLYPYWLSIESEAKIKFYTKEFYSAIAQCPNTVCKIEMEIAKRGDRVRVRTISSRRSCPLGMDGLDIFLPAKGEWLFCPHTLNVIYPYFQVIRNGPSAIKGVKVFSPDASTRILLRVEDLVRAS
jgi:uncharacterized repeat protein (TIGR04076 family)